MQLVSLLLSLPGILVVTSLFLVYVIGLFIFRAYFDSLSHVPGPKLAAATLWYEFYYDVIKKGRYTWEIDQMHKKYGPIVRISPREVHVNDPGYIDRIYPGPQVNVMKYDWALSAFGLKYAGFSTVGHELHRIRRAAISSYFSRASLQHLEPGIQMVIDKMMARLRAKKGTGKTINLLDLYACLTADVISQYAYAKTFGYLDSPDFNPSWHKMIMQVSMNGHFVKQFGFILPIIQSMPVWMVEMMDPLMGALARFRLGFREQALEVQRSVTAGEKPTGQTSIFYELLTNPTIRPQEKEIDYLQDEAQTVIAAGTVTTGHILSMTTFHILSNKSIHQKLQAELRTVNTNPASGGGAPPKWQTLERLPYLTAVIQEGLRTSYGVSHRLQRLFPEVEFTYTYPDPQSPSSSSTDPKPAHKPNPIILPPLTPIGMTPLLLHDNPTLFPSPHEFNPDRFLHNPGLKKYILAFGKGTRGCLGINLAYAELYMTLAAIFTPSGSSDDGTGDEDGDKGEAEKGGVQLALYDTTYERDVKIVHDFFNVSPSLESKGVRVTIV